MTSARVIQVPYLPEPIVFVNKKYFYSAFLDKTLSNAYQFTRIMAAGNLVSLYSLISLGPGAQGNVSAYTYSTYVNDSLGYMESLGEVGYLTVSNDKATPVFPKVKFECSCGFILFLGEKLCVQIP